LKFADILEQVSSSYQQLAAALRIRGVPITHQREAILHFLENNTEHPTAANIITQLKLDVSRATVYNTLNLLESSGMLQLVRSFDGNLHYDPKLEPHHHLQCQQCGRLEDVALSALTLQLDGRTISGPALFKDLCHACRLDPATRSYSPSS
jgi:Fe2+ or Zn2+ uptake regulation protein